MIRKALKIVLDMILSVIVLLLTAVVSTWLAGLILGTTKDASGQEKLNGGGAISIVILLICAAVTIAFAVWFYKFLNRKSNDVAVEE
jgi:uncharacterized BrkB/YihY/UPF0761 family membrane protein